LQELRPSLRVVFALCDVEGLSTEQTAEVLNLTPVAVKAWLWRARLLLRERLSKYFDLGGNRLLSAANESTEGGRPDEEAPSALENLAFARQPHARSLAHLQAVAIPAKEASWDLLSAPECKRDRPLPIDEHEFGCESCPDRPKRQRYRRDGRCHHSCSHRLKSPNGESLEWSRLSLLENLNHLCALRHNAP
jgi:hypothetical protein